MDVNWFHEALARVGASQADLARHLRLAPSAISRMIKGERQMKLLEAAQIAQFLGQSPEEVMRYAGATPEPGPAPTTPRRGRPPGSGTGVAARPRAAEPIPIRSAARGGSGQQMFLADGPIGYTARPTNLD